MNSAIETLLADGVTPLIHENDLHAFVRDHGLGGKNARAHYFDEGRKSAGLLRDIIESDTLVLPGAEFDLLEFASGYGRVTRHLPDAIPSARITACAIHEEAVSFIETEIGQKAVLSCTDPNEFDLGSQFEVVFALSFFSHVPQSNWDNWLVALFRHVRPGGSLVFTTNGKVVLEQVYKNSVTLSPDGFWFGACSQQAGLDTAEYGTTIVSPEHVARKVFQRTGGSIALFSQGFWWGTQDLWVVTKLADLDVVKLEKALSKRTARIARVQQSTSRERALVAKNSELGRALHALSNELREREQQLADGDSARRKVFDEILAHERQLASARADVQDREIRDRDQRLVAAGDNLQRLIGDVKVRDQRLVAADADLRRLIREVEARDECLVAADANLRRLVREVQARDERLVAADADLRRLIREVQARDERLVAADADLRRLLAENDDRHQQLVAADLALRRLSDELQIVTGG